MEKYSKAFRQMQGYGLYNFNWRARWVSKPPRSEHPPQLNIKAALTSKSANRSNSKLAIPIKIDAILQFLIGLKFHIYCSSSIRILKAENPDFKISLVIQLIIFNLNS